MRPMEDDKVLAAIDAAPSALVILQVATALARALQTRLEAVHVAAGQPDRAGAYARRLGVEFRLLHGEPIPALQRAAAAPDVRLLVVGCRDRPAGPTPAGHVALALIEQLSKPVVVVPPQTRAAAGNELSRVLVPLDDTDEASAAVEPIVRVFAGSGLEVTVLHVFDEEHPPAFLDQSHHALEAWGHEFLARHADTGLKLVLRSGTPRRRVLDVAADEHVDLITMGWSQDLSPGHAHIIRELLRSSLIPLLLLPVGTDRHGPGTAAPVV